MWYSDIIFFLLTYIEFSEEYEGKKNLLGLIKTVNKQSVYFRKVIGLENAPYQFDSSDIEKVHYSIWKGTISKIQNCKIYLFTVLYFIYKAYKFENIVPKIDLLLRMAYFKNYMRQDIFKNTAGLVTLWIYLDYFY